MPPPATTTPLRADARRHRDQILDVAARAFVEVGTDVPMDEVARRAGVGSAPSTDASPTGSP